MVNGVTLTKKTEIILRENNNFEDDENEAE